MKNGRGTIFRAGDETLGGKRNYSPYGTGSGRRFKSDEHELPVRPFRGRKWGGGGACLPSYGIVFLPHAAFTGRSHDRMRSTGAGGCENRVCYCQSLRGVSPTKARANVVRREGGRRSFDPSTRGANTESRLRGREMRPFAVWLEAARTADVPGTREVLFPGHRLHVASPTSPGPPGSGPLCPGCGVLYVARDKKEMPVLSLFFDTTLGLGATKLRATFIYPFLHLAERFETLAVVVTFSPFWAGKISPSCKINSVCYCSPLPPRLPGKT